MQPTALIYSFLKELDDFAYTLSSLDRVWNILCPEKAKKKWHHLHVNKYKHAFYITHVSGNAGSLEVEQAKGARIMNSMGVASHPVEDHPELAAIWAQLIISARAWLKTTRRDWITANKKLQVEYPFSQRYGVAPNCLIRASLPDVYRLDRELGRRKTANLVHLIEGGYFFRTENTQVSSMTANDFFEYCRIAYIAGKRKDDKVDAALSGREMYELYADGRHDGLLEIDPACAHEFADWIDGKHPRKRVGGHPWEIKRGGNTTHIDLTVSRPSSFQQEGFKIELRGESIGRMVETMRMFLAINQAGLPISIANPEAVRKRLLAQDNIGIVPSYASLHRANQHFSRDEDVFDVMHYDDLSRFKRRITPFIRWEPLPILKPKDA